MKKLIFSLFLSAICLNGFGITWQIVNSGYTFSPETLTINQGDNVNFVLASIHDAVEVSQTVWTNNGNTPVIGFSVPFGGGAVLPTQLTVGTHYYVCSPHAASKMKGIIIVQASSAIEEHKTQNDILVYPNPIKDRLTIQLNSSYLNPLEINLFNVQGQLVNILLPKTSVSGLYLHTFYLENNTHPGVYFMQIALGNKISYTKVLIQ